MAKFGLEGSRARARGFRGYDLKKVSTFRIKGTRWWIRKREEKKGDNGEKVARLAAERASRRPPARRETHTHVHPIDATPGADQAAPAAGMLLKQTNTSHDRLEKLNFFFLHSLIYISVLYIYGMESLEIRSFQISVNSIGLVISQVYYQFEMLYRATIYVHRSTKANFRLLCLFAFRISF